MDELVQALVAVATSDVVDDGDRMVALKQLRRVCQTSSVRPVLLLPLLQHYSRCSEPMLDPFQSCLAARAIAAAGPDMDALVLQELDSVRQTGGASVCFLMLALALARNSVPAVTADLSAIAAVDGPEGWRGTLLPLALAARDAESAAPAEKVARALERIGRGDIGSESSVDYANLLLALPYVAEKLTEPNGIPPVLWDMVLRAEDLNGAVLPILSYSMVAASTRDHNRLRSLRARVKGADLETEGIGAAVGHLAFASVAADRRTEVESALSILARHGHTTADWFLLQIVADTLVESRFRADLSSVLVSGSSDAKQGALRLIEVMGPDAYELLPEVAGLEDNPRFRSDARRVGRIIAGLNASGEWILPEAGK